MNYLDKLAEATSPPRSDNFIVKERIKEENPDYKEIYQFTYETYFEGDDDKFGLFFLIFTLVIPIFWIMAAFLIWDIRRTYNRVEIFYDSPEELVYIEILFGNEKKRKTWKKKNIDNIILGEKSSNDSTYYAVSLFEPVQEFNSRKGYDLVDRIKSSHAKRIFLDFMKKLEEFGYPVEQN